MKIQHWRPLHSPTGEKETLYINVEGTMKSMCFYCVFALREVNILKKQWFLFRFRVKRGQNVEKACVFIAFLRSGRSKY